MYVNILFVDQNFINYLINLKFLVWKICDIYDVATLNRLSYFDQNLTGSLIILNII